MDYDTACAVFQVVEEGKRNLPDSGRRVRMMFEGGKVAECLAETEIQRERSERLQAKRKRKSQLGIKCDCSCAM
ncbi:hypothetical protein K0M31_010972 [Melipona bicolor]|uniref:Uncharacterized protein n=1 Tax=Melipona bicolor TaxID=60889 RepID=A0AA40FKE5_9HYME|nr:hypothetical protein K0M31_010972 [Melipona bicolor]